MSDPLLDDLRKKFLWKAPTSDSGRFLNVFMDQSNKCNLRCRMCGFSDPRAAGFRGYDLPRWLFDKIAADLFPRTRYVCLSLFAEPLMTRDFIDRLHALRTFAVPFSEMITNGTLLTAPIARALAESALTRISVSIDGATKELFEWVRPGARFEQVIANWHLLKAARDGAPRPLLRINHVLTPLNIDRFDDFLKLAESLGADELSVRHVSRMSRAEIQETTDPAFWDAIRAARARLTDFCDRTGIVNSGFLRHRPEPIELHLDDGEIMTCRHPWNVIAIHPNGDAFPCLAWTRPPVGSFVSETLDEIWNGPALQAVREEFERVRPGVDCDHCTIRRAEDDGDDDFFYRKLMEPPAPGAPPGLVSC